MKTMMKILTILAITVLLMPGTQVALADARISDGILPPEARPYGHTLAEWGARIFQKIYATPAAQNPITGMNDDRCGYVMDGKMALLWTNPGAEVPYSCTIPANTLVTTPIFGVWCDSNLDNAQTPAELRQCVDGWYQGTTADAWLDGVKVKNIYDYLVITASTPYTTSTDNVFGLPAGTTGQFMFKGGFIILTPLSSGTHTLRIRDVYPTFGNLVQDFTMVLQVTR